MPKIEIDTCPRTPNYDALEAIARTMRNNYTQRNYQHENIIKVESGRILRVIETQWDVNLDYCKYRVELVERVET